MKMTNAWKVVSVLFVLLLSPSLCAESFRFVALGDTAYEIPQDYPGYQALIARINEDKPAFSIHIGDTKGWGDCGDEFQLSQLEFFNSYEQPVFYALGNNEWADCWKDNRGNHDPMVVLNSMRRIFFPEPRSMGKTRMDLVRQSDTEGEKFSAYAENGRWTKGEATFLTVNVVGEHNNQFLRDEKLWKDFVEREQANIAWINAGFEAARSDQHKAIVIAMHSDIFTELGQLEGGAFQPVLQAIASNALTFAGQVLVVHGHEHTFIIDKPLRVWDDEATTTVHDNVTRLQVYGWPDTKAVAVSVDTSKPWVFGFEPLYGDDNLSPAFTD
jgi:hypothetical protein